MFKWLCSIIAGLATMLLLVSVVILLKPAESLPAISHNSSVFPAWFDISNNLSTTVTVSIVPSYLKNPAPATLPPKPLNDENSVILNNLLESGDFETTIVNLRRKIEENPYNAQALGDLGVSLLLYGVSSEGTNAVEWLEKAVELKPNALNWAYLARAYGKNYQPQKALSAANKAVNSEPNSATARAVLALLQKDVKELDLAVKINPTNFWVRLAQVEILDSEPDLDKLLENYPRLGLLYTLKGDMLIEKGDSGRKAAINWYNQALELNSNDVQAYNGLGWVYFSMGQYNKSREFFSSSLSRKPDFPLALVGQGYLKLFSREPSLATEYFSKALQIDSTCAEAYNGVAAVNLNKGNLEQVSAWADLAIKHKPNYADPYYQKGRALYEYKKYHQAVSVLEEAVKLAPFRPHYHEALAFAYFATGQKEASRQAAQKALSLKPDNGAIQKLLKML
jgi:tetratricopeptide (TPR) repeat protein